MKIVYSINSIRGLGGIQRVTLLKANALVEIPQNEVYIIVTDNWMNHPLIHDLSPKIHFINLQINYYKDDYKSKLHQIISNFKIINHYFKLQRTISQIKPDIIISVGQSEKYIVPLLKTNAIKIREIHFNSNYRKFTYRSKIFATLLNFIDFKIISHLYNKIVLLTKENKTSYFPFNNKFIYIHNPVTFKPKNLNFKKDNTIISVGRLSKEKDFLSLIKAWNIINKECNGWKLKIVGEGPERINIEKKINEYNLNDSVILTGYSDNVEQEMLKSSIFVMTSIFEGFPLVLLEAMSCGLVPITFSFHFGPGDVINDNKNGFLVENRDVHILSEKILYLINNENRRKEMAYQAVSKVNDFSIDKIIDKWMNLFQTELNLKNKQKL